MLAIKFTLMLQHDALCTLLSACTEIYHAYFGSLAQEVDSLQHLRNPTEP